MDKFGSRVMAAAALCLLVGGYLLVWAAGSALLPSWACSAWFVTAYFLIIGVGNTATVSGSLVLCTRNFPHQARGKVLGILNGFASGGGIVWALMFLPFADVDHVSFFFLVVAICVGVTSLAGVILYRRVQLPTGRVSHPADRHPKEEQRVQQQIQQDEDEAIAIVKPADAQLELKDMTESHLQSQVPIAANILAINPSMMTPVGKSPISHSTVDVTGWRLLKHPEFILLWIAFMCVTGPGLTGLNNAGSLLRSNQSEIPTVVIVCVLAAANTIGRAFTGFLSDYVLHRFRRVNFLLITVLLIMIAALLFAFIPSSGVVLFGVALTGLAYGATFTIVHLITSEWFGTRHFGQNYGWISLAVAAGSFSLNAAVGSLYDQQAALQHNDPPNVCYGAICFQYGFIFCGCIALLGTVMVILLIRLTRRQIPAGELRRSHA